MTNAQIADTFDQLSDLLEFENANPFRVRAYRNAARTIRGLSPALSAMAEQDPKSLTELDGIGDDLAQKIVTLVTTGALPMLDELKARIPTSVLAMLRIPGLGPKKAATLYRELGIQDLDQLRAACQEGRVRELKGFGQKTEQAILQGLSVAEVANQRIYWADADLVAQALQQHMAACPAAARMELAGSYRRGKDTIGDLDLLVEAAGESPDEFADKSPDKSSAPPACVDAIMDRFGTFAEVASVLARGETKMSVRTHSGLQVDLRVVPRRSFGAALQYFTGSKEHNVVLRGRAKQAGLKINEYGVFRIGENGDEKYVAGESEHDVYATLGLPVFPPELREGRREFEWADAGELPELIVESDMQGDLHMHTTATDGAATLEEMVAAARQRGLRYIAITDHSQRVSMARGLDPHRLLAQWREIDALNERLAGEFLVLKGIECDILEKGGMDLPDDVLAQADWVLASVHYGQKQPREQITERILGAIENPHVSAIAHPTGRLLNRRDPYEVDMEAVFQAVRRHRKLLELNANPMRLDLHDIHCAAAKAHGIPVVINTDAHSVNGLDVMRYGILQARRGGLTRRDVANTQSWANLKELIG